MLVNCFVRDRFVDSCLLSIFIAYPPLRRVDGRGGMFGGSEQWQRERRSASRALHRPTFYATASPLFTSRNSQPHTQRSPSRFRHPLREPISSIPSAKIRNGSATCENTAKNTPTMHKTKMRPPDGTSSRAVDVGLNISVTKQNRKESRANAT